MKIVLITKIIHPTQSPRAFRVMELAKELAKRDYEVIIYANIGNYNYKSIEKKNKIKIKDVGNMKFAIEDSDGKHPNNYFNKVLRKYLGKWAEFPDIEFLWKVPRIIQQEQNTDLLITFAIPHSIHWGTARYRSNKIDNFPSVWIADCGDPFMGNPFKKTPAYFSYFEKFFCRQADYITIPIEEARPAYYPEYQDKIKIIPQGFKFDLPKENSDPNNKVSTFLYAGNFYPPARDPRPFLSFLATLNLDFRFIIHTKHEYLILPYQKILGDKLIIRSFIPRDEMVEKMKTMDFLINLNNGTDIQSPSKLIDYAIAGRPILSVSSHDFDKNTIIEFLLGNYASSFQLKNIDRYRIENVANAFIDLYQKKTINN